VVSEPDDVKQPEHSPIPDASPQPAVSETPFANAGPASATARTSVVEPVVAPPRVARGRGEPRRPAPVPRASRSAASPPRPVAPAPLSPTPESVPSQASAVPPRRPVSPPLSEPPRPSAPPARATAPPPSRAAAAAPANGAPGRRTPPPAPPAPPAASTEPPPDDLTSERDDSGYAATSRLGGLRNLLVSLGRRSLVRDDEVPGEQDIEPRFERATVRPAYPDSPLPEAAENETSTRLTAQPEFLPPKATVEVEKDKEVVRPTPPRRDNVDPDEIQTLPSWRGQYRKKRYPPM
jgi:hypothetical protein